MSPDAGSRGMVRRPWASTQVKSLLALLLLALLLLALVLLHATPPWRIHHDCGWYLYLAQRVLAGDVLYQDLIEVNPPLVVVLHAVPVVLARATGVDLVAAFDLCVLAWLSAGLMLASCVLRCDGVARAARWLFVGAAGFVLAVASGADFGQREHLMVAALLPWLLVVQARVGGAALPTALALGVGLFAGLGCSLKPHFLLAPLFAVVAAAIGGRRRFEPWRPEHLGLLAAVGIYGLTLSLLPVGDRYLRGLGLLRQAYGGMDIGWAGFFAMPWTIQALALLAGLMVLARVARPARRDLSIAIAAVAGAVIAAAWQCKGWSYHLLPAQLLVYLAVVRWLATSPWSRWPRCWLSVLLAAVALPLGEHWLRVDPATGALGVETEFDELPEGIGELRALPPGAAVQVLDTDMPGYFADLARRELRWASRYPHLWPLPTAIGDAGLGAALRAEIVADLRRHRPALLLVRRGTPGFVRDRSFRLGRWLQESAAWRDALGEYQLIRVDARFEVWRRR